MHLSHAVYINLNTENKVSKYCFAYGFFINFMLLKEFIEMHASFYELYFDVLSTFHLVNYQVPMGNKKDISFDSHSSTFSKFKIKFFTRARCKWQ